ncbi:substrate-binding domain-containing protein [bacterium]|nr:substrate-binding domain-containing protein [bacterium]
MMRIRYLIILLLLFCSFVKDGYASENEKRIRIVFFTGGSEGGSLTSIVYNGARLAQKDLDLDVEYVWSGWKSATMISQFKKELLSKPDGIAIMGHPGNKDFGPLIDQAIQQGIIVTSQNAELPISEVKYKDKGFGYVGTDNYAAGFRLGKAAFQRAGLATGDLALVWGLLLSEPSRGLRTKGVIDALEKEKVRVNYIEIAPTINSDASLGFPVIKKYMAENPNTRLIVLDHGALTAASPSFFKAARMSPGDVYVAGFDLSPETVSGIEEGWIGAVLDQQPFLQGYLPILQIYLTKKFGFAGMHIDTGAAIIDKSNINFVISLAQRGIR